jgi:hypothetical protein
MKTFMRFTALATLAAFIGLSAIETFHCHKAHQTEANCAVCQIAHRTPALLSATPVTGPHWTSTPTKAAIAEPSYVQFVFVAHGLSPPAL